MSNTLGLRRDEIHEAHSLAIRARAEMRLAEEYDAAQERREVATVGQRANVSQGNVSTAADLGLARKDIHEARKLRDAERAEPGLIGRTLMRSSAEEVLIKAPKLENQVGSSHEMRASAAIDGRECLVSLGFPVRTA